MLEEEARATSLKAREHFGFPRRQLHALLLPLIAAETATIKQLQDRYRTPFMDSFMQVISFTGSHHFFMIGIPACFWLGQSQFGRNLCNLLALCTIVCLFFKDALCLPRPFSPPVVKLSDSHTEEFGFPSSHTTTTVNMIFFTYFYFVDGAEHSTLATTLCLLACFAWCVLLGASRVYCGMHSVTDVVGGMLCGFVVLFWWTTYYKSLDYLYYQPTWSPLWVILLGIALIVIHPDPIQQTPSFDDGVSFVWSSVGAILGTYALVRHEGLDAKGPIPGTTIYDYNTVGFLTSVLRLLLGVGIVLVWRAIAKPLCKAILPPIYKALGFDSSVPEQKKESKGKKGAAVELYRIKRYSPEVAARCIMYTGIGFLAAYGIPLAFQYLGMERSLF